MSLLKIITKDNPEEFRVYNYEYLMDVLGQEERNKILKSWYEQYPDIIRLECSCDSNNPVPMSLVKTPNQNYSIRTYPNKKSEHREGCPYYGNGEYQSNGFMSSVIFDKDNKIKIAIKKEIFQPLAKQKTSCNEASVNIKTLQNSDNSQSYATLRTLITMILIKAWDDYIFWEVMKKEKSYPTLVNIYEQIIRTVRSISLTEKLSLFNIMYKRGKLGACYQIQKEYKTYTFFILKYVDKLQSNQLNKYIVQMENPKDSSLIECIIERKTLDDAFASIRVAKGPYMIGGFMKSADNIGGAPEIVNVAIVPINENGVVIESSYERKLYDYLCREKRLVQRIYYSKFHSSWNGIKPDGLFIDTEPQTVIEVFGMSESNKEYHAHKEMKIKHFSTLKDHHLPKYRYDLWYWNAYTGEEIPQLPAKKKE